MTISAEQRVAQIRSESAARGTPLDHLSDLEVLNAHYEAREHDWIDTRDRYMGVLHEQRLNEERVRAACVKGMKERVDVFATDAVQRLAGDLTRILTAVDALPERANANRVALLKEIASQTRNFLRHDDRHPARVWRLDDYYTQVKAARNVLDMLRDRDGIPAAEVIRLVGEALTPDGNLKDLFDVADTGTCPEPEKPPFAGANWREYVGYWAFEPQGDGARLVAYAHGETWFLDLYSPAGALLAYGQTQTADVARTTAALISRAPVWALTRGYAWKRFADVAP